MRNYFSFTILIFTLLLLDSCKSTRVVSQSTQDQKGSDSLSLAQDSLSKSDTTKWYLTSKGDTLFTLDSTVTIEINRILKDTITLKAVGDIMMGTNFPSPSYLPGDQGYTLWNSVKPVLKDADITFGNLEGTILNEGGEAKECRNPKACYLFRTPESLSFHFKEAGFDLLSLANNHANDFGETGRKNTQRVLDSLEIAYSGSVEKPFTILRRKGFTIGLLSMAPNKGTISIHDEEYAVKTVSLLDSLTDIAIVSLHIGAEGSKNQRITRKREFYYGEDRGNVYELSRLLIDAGADVILGHGPHVVRAIDLYKERIIAYSLGNFLTYGRFNLRGPNAYAPILELKISPEGKFLEGFIHSYIQDYSLGPLKDSRGRAREAIKKLTELDFPESQLTIDEKGRISYLHP